MVLANLLVLGVAFSAWRRVVGLHAAISGFLLIGLDPFEIGFARLLHPDGLLYGLMLLSVIAALGATTAKRAERSDRDDEHTKGRHWGMLALSGAAAGSVMRCTLDSGTAAASRGTYVEGFTCERTFFTCAMRKVSSPTLHAFTPRLAARDSVCALFRFWLVWC